MFMSLFKSSFQLIGEVAQWLAPQICSANFFEGFTSIPTALTASDRNQRIQVYQAGDG